MFMFKMFYEENAVKVFDQSHDLHKLLELHVSWSAFHFILFIFFSFTHSFINFIEFIPRGTELLSAPVVLAGCDWDGVIKSHSNKFTFHEKLQSKELNNAMKTQ